MTALRVPVFVSAVLLVVAATIDSRRLSEYALAYAAGAITALLAAAYEIRKDRP